MKLLKISLILFTVFGITFLIIFFSFGGFGSKVGGVVFNDSANPPLLFAHRGVIEDIPENSLESIGEAKRLGFTAVEFDLRKSADSDFILFHDVDANRMLGSRRKIKKISTTGLDSLPFISDGKSTGFLVPTLTEVLDRYHADFIFYFDMKLTGFSEADQIAEIIRKYGIEKTVIVASADYLFNLYMEFRYPEIITALEGLNAGKEWTYNIIPKNLKPDYLSGFLSNIDEDHIAWLGAKGLLNKRIVYGVDSTNYLVAKAMGIRNIILDYNSISPVFNDIRLNYQ